jgi:hypothetical protein
MANGKSFPRLYVMGRKGRTGTTAEKKTLLDEKKSFFFGNNIKFMPCKDMKLNWIIF